MPHADLLSQPAEVENAPPILANGNDAASHYIAVARALRPLLSQYAAQAEQDGRVAKPVMDALWDAGLFHVTVPLRSGGPALTLSAHTQIIGELAKACPGSAWAYGLLSGVTGTAKAMPETVQRSLFRTGKELFCSVSANNGIATPVEGGYKVQGEWGYGSGCLHASWALNGLQLRNENGELEEMALGFIDLTNKKTVEIIHDWNVAGLSGSGSNRIKANQHFIPHHLLIRPSQTPPPEALHGLQGLEPRDFWPWEPLFALGVLSPILGAASGLCEMVLGKMENRKVIGWHYDSQASSHLLLHKAGEAAMKIESAWMHVERACNVMDNIAPKRLASPFEKSRAQADCGYAMGLVKEASNILMDIAGPGGFALANAMQRLWRDINLGSRHNALNAGLSLELYGRALTGQSSNITLLGEIAPSEAEREHLF